MSSVACCSCCWSSLDGPPPVAWVDDRPVPELPAHLLEGPPVWWGLTPPEDGPDLALAGPAPEMPAWVAEDVVTQAERWLSPDEYARLVAAGGTPEVMDELDSPFRSPRALVEDFAAAWAEVQAATAGMWRAAVAVEAAAGARRAEFVGDDWLW